jgi:hypothetical protein
VLILNLRIWLGTLHKDVLILEQMRLTLSKPQEMRKLNFSTYNGCTNWVSGSIQAPNPEKSLAAVQQPGQLHLQ